MEVLTIGKHLLEVNFSTMREFVIKQVEESEHHLSCYPSRPIPWEHVKSKTNFVKILEYFLNFDSFMQAVAWVLNDLLVCFSAGARHHRLELLVK